MLVVCCVLCLWLCLWLCIFVMVCFVCVCVGCVFVVALVVAAAVVVFCVVSRFKTAHGDLALAVWGLKSAVGEPRRRRSGEGEAEDTTLKNLTTFT